jgi:hypothetical protein
MIGLFLPFNCSAGILRTPSENSISKELNFPALNCIEILG